VFCHIFFSRYKLFGVDTCVLVQNVCVSDLFHEIKIGILVHNTACDHAIVTNRRKDFIKIVDVEFLKDWINSEHGEKKWQKLPQWDHNYVWCVKLDSIYTLKSSPMCLMLIISSFFPSQPIFSLVYF